MHHPTDRMTQTTANVTPVVEHWLEWIDGCLNGQLAIQTEWKGAWMNGHSS